MTDKTKLLEYIIGLRSWSQTQPNEYVRVCGHHVLEAAQTLLSLYEQHDIQALIDGKAEVKKRDE